MEKEKKKTLAHHFEKAHSSFSKASLPSPQTGHSKSSGRSSKGGRLNAVVGITDGADVTTGIPIVQGTVTEIETMALYRFLESAQK